MHQTIWNSRQPPTEGAWGLVTASIDWCEENYAVSYYIAEFYNTISNAFIIFFGLFGFAHIRGQNLPAKYAYAMLGLTAVGLGSFGFHSTLRYDWQLLDELPMVFASSLVTYLLLDAAPATTPNTRARALLPYGVFIFDVLFSLAYLYYHNPVFHQVIYALIQVVSTLRGLYMTFLNPTGNPTAAALNKTSWRMQWTGSVIFLLGFLVWNLDNVFCDNISDAKRYLNGISPHLGAILEGHAWWHFLTGLGAYYVGLALILVSLVTFYNVNGYSHHLDSISIEYKFLILPKLLKDGSAKRK